MSGRDAKQRTIVFSRVVHLSHVIHPAIPCWPGDPPVRLEPLAYWDEDGFYLQRLSLGEHSGTHLNAPRHFHPGGSSVDELEAERFVVQAVVIDGRLWTENDPDFTLQPSHIRRWEEEHGAISRGSLVVFHTGWDRHWGDSDAFFGRRGLGPMRFPGFSEDSVAFLIDERGVAGFGTDAHGIDPGWDDRFSANRLALQRSKLVLENLTNLAELPPTGSTLVIGVLRLRGGSGSPASVLALVP